MKKTIKLRFTLVLLVAMLMAAANTQAEEYDLWICGVQVTDNNKDDLTVINDNRGRIVKGTVKYHPETKTLELFKANIKATKDLAEPPIRSEIEGLTIEVLGNNNGIEDNRSSPSKVAINLNGTTIFRGKGWLYVFTTSYAITSHAFNLYYNVIVKEECHLDVNSGVGFCSQVHGSLIVDAARVTAKGTGDGAIIGFDGDTGNNIHLNDCAITYPEHARIIRGNVCNADGTIAKNVVIMPTTTKYDLYIGGMQVTSFNKDKLNELRCVTAGNVTYNPYTKTLRLENATIDTGKDYLGVSPADDITINSSIDGLKIELVGNNTLIAATLDGINLSKNATIISNANGTLNITAPSAAINVIGNSEVTIKHCTVNATGGERGIRNEDKGGAAGTLNINGANITATGTTHGSIVDFNKINLNYCTVTEPAGAKITDGSITDASGNIIKAPVKIAPIPPEKYNLWICGTQVTEANKDDLTVINGTNGCTITGTVKYNPGNTTLTLNNANIDIPNSANAIKSDIEGLKIDVQGDNNSVNSDGSATMRFDKSATIKGGGKLNVSHSDAQGWTIYASGSSVLTIDDCTVNATSTGRSITGDDGGTLTINNATVTSTGPNGSITHFANINLNGCAISEPAGARVSKGADSFNAIRNAAGVITTATVKILPATVYNLKICGVPVTSLNTNDLSVIPGVTGTASYNPDNTTLTLNGVTIEATTNAHAIVSDIEGLKVEVNGTNNVSSSAYSTMRLNKSCTIKGSGTLNVSHSNNGWALYADNSSLTIENCTINATNGSRGITGNDDGSSTLTLNNATVTAFGTGSSITRFAGITLNDCAVIEPAGAVASKGSDNFYAVRDADGNIIGNQTVKIERTGTGIDNVNAHTITLYPNPVKDILHIQAEEAVTAIHIYNVQGTAVAQATGNIREINLTHLPAGIYMVRIEAGESVSTMRVVKK